MADQTPQSAPLALREQLLRQYQAHDRSVHRILSGDNNPDGFLGHTMAAAYSYLLAGVIGIVSEHDEALAESIAATVRAVQESGGDDFGLLNTDITIDWIGGTDAQHG